MAAPLVTTPYISRCLGVERIGEYSYAYSLVSYFILKIKTSSTKNSI